MKQIFLLSIAIITLTACNHDKREIQQVAYGYLYAMGNYQIDDAYQYADSATQRNALDYIKDVIIPMTDSNYLKKNTPATITINNITIENDTNATIKYHKSTPINEQDGDLNVRKENGQWKAHIAIKAPQILTMGIDTIRAQDIEKLRGRFRKADSTEKNERKQRFTNRTR